MSTNDNPELDQYLDQPFDLIEEETDYNIEVDENFLNGIVTEDTDQGAASSQQSSAEEIIFDDEDKNQNQPNGAATPAAEKPNENDIDFEDKETKTEDQDTFKAEEAIEKLKALGYNVGKDGEQVDPSQLKINEINTINATVSNLQKFIQQDDMALCRQKVTQDLLAKFKAENRNVDPNSEEFKLELAAEMQEYEYSPKMAALEAKAIRNDLKDYIAQEEGKRDKIQKEIEDETAEKTKTHRVELQTAFKTYVGKTLFGQKIEPDTVKKAYNKITTGDFAKMVNSSKDIQAKFALFVELQEQIEASGGGTFGEGAAAAVNAINGKPGPVSKTSLDKTLQRSSAGNTLADRYASWSERTAVPQKQ